MTTTAEVQRLPGEEERETSTLACKLGYWSSLLTTLGGVAYFVVLGGAALTGNLSFPPTPALQTFGGVFSLLACPIVVIVIASLHNVTPHETKVWSQISLAFTLLFAIAVSINRFTQFGAIRQSLAAGNSAGVRWFLPYDSLSVMFGLEFLGWGWFLGLAMLSLVPLFKGNRVQQGLRWSALLYGLLGMTSAAAYLFASPLAVVGFLAWGFVFYVFTALLSVYFMSIVRR